MTELTNHLWQSSLFAVLAALVALGLRKRPAKVRHAVWVAASMKFAVPFSLLVSLGTRVDVPSAAPAMPALAVEQLTISFSPVPVSRSTGGAHWPKVLQAIWITGALLLVVRWGRRWLILRRAVGTATRLPIAAPLPVLSTETRIEPGVFGLFRPVLLLPRGIVQQLSGEQLDAVLAHELAHVRRRDNLTAALQMGVEAVFWFHPLVYAESILSVCRFSVESPLECASGVSGADEEILTKSAPVRLTWVVASMLVAVAAVTLAVPLAIGVLRAQTLPPAPQYRFEVASIRPGRPGAQGGGMSPGPQGGFRAEKHLPTEDDVEDSGHPTVGQVVGYLAKWPPDTLRQPIVAI
jgi:beta-lactamase regulating signal transducer with metallopeptidase domain